MVSCIRGEQITFNSIQFTRRFFPFFHHSLIHSNYHDWSNYDLIMDYTRHGKFSYKKLLVLANSIISFKLFTKNLFFDEPLFFIGKLHK